MNQFIKINLFNKAGKYNSRKLNKGWFVKNGYVSEYNTIISNTQYLEKDTPFTQRIYFAHNNINNLLICKQCEMQHQRLVDRMPSEYCSSICARKSPDANNKRIKTSIERFGTEHFKKLTSSKKQQSENMTARWKSDRASMLNSTSKSNQAHIPQEILDILDNKDSLLEELTKNDCSTQMLSKHLNVYYGTVIERLRKFDLYKLTIKTRSALEISIVEFIKNHYNKTVETSVTGLLNNKKLEIDIFVPERNFAIEVNGLYYHSDKFKNNDYHINKTKDCNSQNINLMHIFGEFTDIHKSMILHNLGLSKRTYARDCTVHQLDKTPAQFLDDNHIQGSVNSTTSLCLKDSSGNMLAVMTFGRARFDKTADHELLRYCNKCGNVVVGGFSKLLSAFKKFNSGKLISYANRTFSKGNVYMSVGFEYVSESLPSYKYTNGTILLSRYQCQRSKLERMFSKTYGKGLSENDIMVQEGYYKIYDCGTIKYSINI